MGGSIVMERKGQESLGCPDVKHNHYVTPRQRILLPTGWLKMSAFPWTRLVNNIFGRSQRNVTHVTTVVVVGRAHFEPEHCKFCSNFEFDRNTVSGTGVMCIICLRTLVRGSIGLKWNIRFSCVSHFYRINLAFISVEFQFWRKTCNTTISSY